MPDACSFGKPGKPAMRSVILVLWAVATLGLLYGVGVTLFGLVYVTVGALLAVPLPVYGALAVWALLLLWVLSLCRMAKGN